MVLKGGKMKDLIITINANTRKIKNSKNFLGINGENLNGNFIVDFEDEFIDGFAYLEVFDGSQKYLLTMEKVEDHYVLPILSSLLATVGDLQCQVRINSQFDANSVSVFKSEIFKLSVLEAINATETIPEEYPTWIEEADLKILNIQNDLNAEITARENADTTLQGNITAEQTARENADTTLQNNITAEETARQNADTTLQNNITAEETARQNADTTLQNNITAEQTARENADTTLQNNVTAEETARQNADTNLQNQITSLTERTIIRKICNYEHTQSIGTNATNLMFSDGSTSVSFTSHGGRLKISGGIYMYQVQGGNHYVSLSIDGQFVSNPVITNNTNSNTYHSLDFITDTALSVGTHTIEFKIFTNAYTCNVNESSQSQLIFEEIK